MEIKGYTLHGDYYLADKVIPNKNWKEAIKMKEEIALPNGKKVIAHTLSKEELETIPKEERDCRKWYWTSTPYDDDHAWTVHSSGDFLNLYINYSNDNGGARLGFKNPF
jgi:predicted glutamine amidotransferase